jgi:Right handed beta helix region
MKNWRRTALALAFGFLGVDLCAGELRVSPRGNDDNPGTASSPLASFAGARGRVRVVKAQATDPITVIFHKGTYRLPETLVFGPEDSGSEKAPITYTAAPGEEVVVSGGVELRPSWKAFRNGIVSTAVPREFDTDQLFVNGQRQTLARYPNLDPRSPYFGGYVADAFGPARAQRWADPRGGFIHAMHQHLWGDFHYVITGKGPGGAVTFDGGWQNNRRMGMHDKIRFVDNILEELDAPGEWFLDKLSHTLYFFPPAGVEPGRAVVEGVRLRHLVEFRGRTDGPVTGVTLRGFTFRHAARSFMENREPLLRSDWTIYRGGAILFAGADHCSLEDSTLDGLGGNAVFVSGRNRRVTIRGCHIVEAGASGVAFVGDPSAVRSPLYEYNERQGLAQIDRSPGPKNDLYPADCLLEDCLIERTGRVEKQSAPVEIAMALGVSVRHCTIHDVPRAGINIGDGCWGGHVIEFCDVFDTVKETGDHGSFNSWGRDRYWGLKDVDLNTLAAKGLRDLPRLDVVKPIVLRNNRWRCDHGWDIDLDDGSSNFRIENNLCLNGGIKLREGFDRVCENNIMVANSFHPHVWYRGSDDVFLRNIVFTKYAPIDVPTPWGRECDFNLLHRPGESVAKPALVLQAQSGRDQHSLIGDARFLDPASGDFRVANDSPAIELGFKNFRLDQFGVQSARLRRLAQTPAGATISRASSRPSGR